VYVYLYGHVVITANVVILEIHQLLVIWKRREIRFIQQGK
jgi:hypothetical protein